MRTSYIVNEIKRLYGFEVHRVTVMRGKKMAKKRINGDIAREFELVRDYGATLLKYNNGSTVIVKSDATLNPLRPRFERMYYCLAACKGGFVKGCRPFFGLDGCHLKGKDGGQLLSVVSRDANDGLFPITMAWVEAETRESWL